MGNLVEILISSVDFLRAEMQDVKGGLFALVTALAMLLVAVLFLAAGLALILTAVYFSLRPSFSPAGASLFTAISSLIIAGGLGWLAIRKTRR